jgi:hypothetical protein
VCPYGLEALIRWLPLIFVILIAAVVVEFARATPPRSFVEAALCVHSGWHYTSHRQHNRPEYVLWHRGYWRTWNVPDSTLGGSGEGSWDAHNYGYGGGMQMDTSFQRRYGPEFLRRYGPAGRWPVSVQLRVAYRGWRIQGWGAWPQTSHACGLR